jgi:hypothetical protein
MFSEEQVKISEILAGIDLEIARLQHARELLSEAVAAKSKPAKSSKRRSSSGEDSVKGAIAKKGAPGKKAAKKSGAWKTTFEGRGRETFVAGRLKAKHSTRGPSSRGGSGGTDDGGYGITRRW